jgi:hypothetical protein
VVGDVVDRGRACVGEAADAVEPRLDRLEDDDGPVHVHACTAFGIGADERHLHGREVDDVRDRVLVERRTDRAGVRDVSRDERDVRALVLRQHEPKPGVVRAGEVEPHRLLAQSEERLQRPRAETAERSRDERAAIVSQAARPDRR